MAMEARVDIFGTKSDAEEFFEDRVRRNPEIDGLMIKKSGHFSLYKSDEYQGEIDEGREIYLVISFTKGATGLSTDISSAT